MIYQDFYSNTPKPQLASQGQFVQLPRSQQYVPGGLETLQIGTGDTVFNIDKQGMWLGNRLFANAPFKVDMDGNVTFQGGNTGWTTPANLTPDKTFDADSTSTAELADVLGTLIEWLKTVGIISA